MHLDGVAGSGKSILIDMISFHMAYHAAQCRHSDPVLQAAPTGVAVYNFYGSMLHQLLSLLVNRPWYKLGGEKLAAMQAEFPRCKLLIIDEKSMIRFKILHQIEMLLRSIITCPDSFFGGMNPNFCSFHCFLSDFLEGINILLCDDFVQLSLVGDNALYTVPIAFKASVAVITGKAAYDTFTKTVVLTEVMR